MRTDVTGESHRHPPRASVYVAQDNPFATLQFASRGNADGVLGEAVTLNETGRRFAALLGREAMWTVGERMALHLAKAFRRGELRGTAGRTDALRAGCASSPAPHHPTIRLSLGVPAACRTAEKTPFEPVDVASAASVLARRPGRMRSSSRREAPTTGNGLHADLR